jgi:hypothetical protein
VPTTGAPRAPLHPGEAAALRRALLLVEWNEGDRVPIGDYGTLRALAVALGVSPHALDDDLGERLGPLRADYAAAALPPPTNRAASAAHDTRR